MFFSNIFEPLKSSVGNNMDNDPEDVRNVKTNLRRIGYFNDDADPEPHGIITRELDTGIKSFQRDHDLREDGRLRPGGETETALAGRINRDTEHEDTQRSHDVPPKPSRKPERDMPPVPQRKPETDAERRKRKKEALDKIIKRVKSQKKAIDAARNPIRGVPGLLFEIQKIIDENKDDGII